MPIYTARAPTGSLKPTQLLELRGINLRCSTPTMLGIYGIAHYTQVAYRSYIGLLSPFLQAAVLKQEIRSLIGWHRIIVKEKDQIPIPSPTVIISFKSNCSADEVVALSNLGAVEFEGQKKQRMYRFREFSTDIHKSVLAIKRDIHKDCPVLFGQVNLSGYQAFLIARGLITAFLKTQYYPAFSGPKDKPPPVGRYETIPGFMSLKRKIVEEHVARRQGGVEAEGHDDDVDMDVEAGAEDDYEGLITETIVTARPPDEDRLGYGQGSGMPTTTGNVFPFFTNLLEDDPLFIGSVVKQYFIQCFGDNHHENTTELKKFLSGIGQLSQSETGHILNHIFLGIKLAIEVQGSLYVCLSNQKYSGFSLHGYYYTVFVGGLEYAPDSVDVMQGDMLVIDEHATAVGRILAILGKTKGGAAKVKGKKVVDFTHPRQLRSLIKSFTLTEEQIADIDKYSSSLGFRQVFWRFTVENVLKAVDLLNSEAEPGVLEPMFTAGGVLTTAEPETSIFALFGDHGFSFKVPGGEGKKLPKNLESDTLFKPYKDRKSGKTVNPTQNLVMAKKDLRQCRKDWLDFAKDHVWVTREQRAAAFRSELFTGNSAKNMWLGLIKAMPAIAEDTSESLVAADTIVGGKRKRDDDDEGSIDFTDFM